MKHDKIIIPSVFHPGAIRLFPRSDPPRSGRLKMSLAGSTPIGEIPGTARCVIRAVVVGTRYEGSGPPLLTAGGRFPPARFTRTPRAKSTSSMCWPSSTGHGLTRLAWLDERADELVTQYLTAHVAAGRSAYTVQSERAALRLFFGNWGLAATVRIPTRTRTTITRSRGPAGHDRHFQPAHWQAHIRFAQACGLRRAELRDLRVRDVYTADDGTLFVHVKSGKGGKAREVPVLPGHEEDVLAVVQGRAPYEKVFDHIPKHLDVHSYRRDSAQQRYLQRTGGQALPPVEGRLRHENYDPVAVQKVSWALGHNRLDVVLRHYLR